MTQQQDEEPGISHDDGMMMMRSKSSCQRMIPHSDQEEAMTPDWESQTELFHRLSVCASFSCLTSLILKEHPDLALT